MNYTERCLVDSIDALFRGGYFTFAGGVKKSKNDQNCLTWKVVKSGFHFYNLPTFPLPCWASMVDCHSFRKNCMTFTDTESVFCEMKKTIEFFLNFFAEDSNRMLNSFHVKTTCRKEFPLQSPDKKLISYLYLLFSRIFFLPMI